MIHNNDGAAQSFSDHLRRARSRTSLLYCETERGTITLSLHRVRLLWTTAREVEQ